MSDRFKFTQIAHANRKFLGPYDESALREIVLDDPLILDIGCGKGAALAALGGRGYGIEFNPAFAAEAREANPGAQIFEEDARECISRVPTVELIICLGAAQALGSPREAMMQLSDRLEPGGRLLFGDGYWRQRPDPEYLAFLGAEESDMMSFEELIAAPAMTVLGARESTLEDWAAYEDSYHDAVMSWCHENPEDGDCNAFRERITKWRDAYLRWGRHTLGFGMVLWQKG